MEEEYLVEETSFDYNKKGTIVGGDYNHMPKEPSVKTIQALGKINFSGYNDDDNVLLDTLLELSPLLKNLVTVSIKKSFTLDIGLDKVVGKSSQKKLIILVNTNLKKSVGCSDRAVVLKKILVGTSAEAMYAVLSEFGVIKSIKMQLQNQADLLAAKWSILIGKDIVCVARSNHDKKTWNLRDQHRALLYTLPVGTNTHDIWDFIGSVRCAIVCFELANALNAVMRTIPVLRNAHLHWSCLGSVVCAKCRKLGYTFLDCISAENLSSGSLSCHLFSDANKSQLAAIYAKCLVPVAYSVSFGNVSWAKVVGGFSFPPLPILNGVLNIDFFLEEKPTLVVFLVLNDRFVTLERSLASLAEHVDKLAKRLNTLRPVVSQLSPGCQPLVTPLSQNQEADIVMSESLGVATSDGTVTSAVVFDPSIVSKMEKTAFLDVISNISLGKLSVVVNELPNSKAVGLSGITNKLWKHCGDGVLVCFLDLLNSCLKAGNVLGPWKEVWVSMIPKPYDWNGVLTNTKPIALIETVRKILFKILLDQISFVCSKFDVFCGDNFLVLKDTSTQSPVFAVGSVVKDALEKDFGLLDGYKVYNGLDQDEVFSSLLWRIFYDSLLCEVKRQEHLCSYRINSNFVAKMDRIEVYGKVSFFFAAGAFVDDTIWVSNSMASMQYILDIASEFFSINDIFINNDKTVVILINQRVVDVSLYISGQPIFITKKGKSYRYLGIFLSMKGFFRPSLAKAHEDRLKAKAFLSKDFPNEALHYSSLYGVKFFEQMQTEAKIASVVGFSNASGILGRLFVHCALDLQVLGWALVNPLHLLVKLKHWKKLSPYGPVPVWFNKAFMYMTDHLAGFNGDVADLSCSNFLESSVFLCVHKCLHKVWARELNIFTDGSLSELGTAEMACGVAAYFSEINAGVGVEIRGLAIALALKCVLLSCSVVLHSNSQAALAACVSEYKMGQPDFWNKCWGHLGNFGNDYADVLACEAGPGVSVLSELFLWCVNWKCTVSVWHPNSHMLAGFTSRKSAALCIYLIKAIHERLPVAVHKRLYNHCYPNVLCLMCEEVEFSDHAFICPVDVLVHLEIIFSYVGLWKSLVSNVSVYAIICKGFIFRDWIGKAVSIFGNKKKALLIVVDFVQHFAEDYHVCLWLLRSRFRANMEKNGQVCDTGEVFILVHGLSRLLSDGIVHLLGIVKSFAVSFGL
ncbi:hypothetical protein G9A89_000876 [Geosiphon pyriformis]|nr:hypothetical protein G9A89_000876 [Geosiphon pyriformis]